eukprot:9054651-Alexandrium_andersonii.AAC.1
MADATWVLRRTHDCATALCPHPVVASTERCVLRLRTVVVIAMSICVGVGDAVHSCTRAMRVTA